jgi:hypothetical protein
VPLDGPAAGVGVEDEEALEDMDGLNELLIVGGYYVRDGGDEGDRFGPRGQGEFKKERKKGMVKWGLGCRLAERVLRPG